MKNVFVEGLSNEIRFDNELRNAENRGSPEANWVLVESDPGFGKSRMLARCAVQKKWALARAKAEWTPNWALRDICAALNIAPATRTMTMLDAIVGRLMELQPKAPNLIIDEINLAARKLPVLETLRDITDPAEVILITGANRGTYAALTRYDRIRSRVAAVVPFGPLTAEDLEKVCKELSDVRIHPSLQAEILRETHGELRAVRDVIARIEQRMKSTREVVTVDMWGRRPLIGEHRSLRLVANNG